MRKILYIMSNEPVGGVGSVVKNYQAHFHKDKLTIDFIVFDPNEDTPFNVTVRERGSAVYAFPELSLKTIGKLIKLLRRFYKEHYGEYEIVHVHSPNIAWLCFWNADKYGIKYRIIHSHSTLYSNQRLKSLRNRILCIPIKRIANIYMSCSTAAGEFLFGKNSENVIIVRNAIDCDKYKYDADKRERIRSQLKMEDRIVIGHVGHFNKEKNHVFLINVFEKTIQLEPKAILLLVGEGKLKENIIKMVKEKKLEDKVIFLGGRDDVDTLLQAMDVFVLPSLFEGIPVVGIEAQASGLPCVMSTRVANEFNVGFISYMDLSDEPEMWAQKILEKYGSTNREEGVRLIAEAGYDIKIEAERLEKLYLGL